MRWHVDPASGRPRLIPREDLLAVIREVLGIVTLAWIRIRRTANLLSEEHRQREVLTSVLLSRHMVDVERARNPRTPPLKIKCESTTFSDPALPHPDGRIDIEIVYSLTDDPELYLECKRISTSPDDDPAARARYYVNGGLMRFVDGRYGRDQSWGILIAFVVDGRFEASRDHVADYVTSYRNAPEHLVDGWRPARSFPPRRHVFTTTHRTSDGRTIQLLHLFLPFPRR